jgi:putative transposase
VEELLAQRGVGVTYETVRQWCLKFGQRYANELRRRRPRGGDKWHLDEVVLTIRGKKHSLWRAVDQEGNVLDMRVAEPTQQESRQTIFPQTAQRAALRATGEYH